MRRLLLALLLLVAMPAPAWAAISFIEISNWNGTNTSGGTSGPVQAFSATASGSLVTCAWRVNAQGRTVSVTDNQSNTWVAGPHTTYNGSGDEFFAFYALNATTASNILQVTLHVSGADVFVRGACMSYGGIATANALDKTNSGSGSSTSVSTGSVTTTCANEVLVMYASNVSSATYTAGTGFTSRGTTEADVDGSDDIVSAAGSYTGTSTLSGSAAWAATLMTFADTAAPCSSTATRPRRAKGPF